MAAISQNALISSVNTYTTCYTATVDCTVNINVSNLSTGAMAVNIYITTNPSAPAVADTLMANVAIRANTGCVLRMGEPLKAGESVVIQNLYAGKLAARVSGFGV